MQIFGIFIAIDNHAFALRILVMAIVITLLFVLAYLPWYLKDRKVKAQKAESSTASEKAAKEECETASKN